MTEREWLAESDADIMLEFLRGGLSPRKLRLFTVAIVRPFWEMLIDPRSREAVVVAERVADHPEMVDLLEPAYRQVCDAVPQLPSDRAVHVAAAHAAGRTVQVDAAQASQDAWTVIEILHAHLLEEQGTTEHERRHLYFQGRADGERFMSGVVREIFGDPFRPVAIDPAWLTSTVVALARGIYDECAFDRLPILADALQDAGCENADLLTHLRGDGPHVRGCWGIDLVLGKE